MESIDQKYRELVEYIVQKLWEIYETEQLRPNDMQWIREDCEYVEVNFLGKTPESDYAKEAKLEVPITAKDAIELLSVRLKNTFDSLY